MFLHQTNPRSLREARLGHSKFLQPKISYKTPDLKTCQN